jgi:hypothetical protein
VVVAVTAALLAVPTSGLAANGWSGPTAIDKSNPPENISCPTAKFCAAVGAGGYGRTFNGTSWGAPTNIDPSSNPSGHTLTAVSCPSASFCAAIDGRESVLTFNGGSWSAPQQLEPAAPASGVTCASSSFCVAVDGGGSAFLYGTAAAAPTPLPAPVVGKTADATPVSGQVFVKVSAGKSLDGGASDVRAGAAAGAGPGFVRLTAATQIPIGSEINSLHGSLKLVTTTSNKGKTQGGTFRGAIFKLTQSARGASKGLATLSLVESTFKGAPTYATCKRRGRAADGEDARAASASSVL